MRLGIIGGGRAAWAFGSAWRRAGEPLAGIALRPSSTSPVAELLGLPRGSVAEVADASDLVVAAVSDRALPEIAAALAVAPERVALLHCSGSMTSAVFGGRPNSFSLHPLEALPAVGAESGLRGTLLVFEGSALARPVALEVTRIAGGRFAEIDAAAKPLYHAAAVFGSNYVAALLSISIRLLGEAGLRLDDPTALKGDLARLAGSAVGNWAAQQGTTSFTGPVVRGEREVVRAHIDALVREPDLLRIYRALAEQIAGKALNEWLEESEAE